MKQWKPELCEPVNIKVNAPEKIPYGPSEINSFYHPQKLEHVYVVRGVGPICYNEIGPKHDSY